MAFSESISTELINDQQHFARISNIKFHSDWSGNYGGKSGNSPTPLSKALLIVLGLLRKSRLLDDIL
jgi:hypothetical protein